MAEIVNSLFGVDPESIRQARDTAIQERAMQYAKMDPFQRATAGLYSGVSRLGDSIGGMLGGVDPQLQKSSELKQLASQFDTTSPQGLQEYARALASRGFNQEALQVANAAQGFLGKQAATAKDTAAAARERQAAIPPDVLKAQREAALKQGIRSLGTDESPEAVQTRKTLQDELDALTRGKETTPSDLAKLLAERAKLDPVTNKDSYDAYTAKIKKLTTGKSLGQEIGEGLSPVLAAIVEGQAKKSGEAGGAEVGKQSAAIEGKYTALNSVQDALNVVKKGIYAGGYGPLQEGLAKYSGGVLADKQRLVNTEEFRSYIGDVVIPRLAEFGGNDSVEELKYLRSVLAGETTLESKAIQNILEKAQIKIQRGITRIQEQQKAIAGGKQLPTGPTGGAAQQRTTKSGVTYTKED